MRIETLLPPTKAGGPWRLTLEDGAALQVSEGAMIDFGLHKGQRLTPKELESLQAAEAHRGLRDQAVALLLQRPYSKQELEERLARRGSSREQAEEISAWAQGIGLLDEEAYAGRIVRHYSRKGFGPYKVRDELYRRGIPRALWEKALEELPDPEEAIGAYLQKNLRGGDPRSLKRASDALGRRGFSWSDIAPVLRRFGADWED